MPLPAISSTSQRASARTATTSTVDTLHYLTLHTQHTQIHSHSATSVIYNIQSNYMTNSVKALKKMATLAISPLGGQNLDRLSLYLSSARCLYSEFPVSSVELLC